MDHLLHAGGPATLAILCLVLFVEECGLPLPFLPGDVLLVAGGIMVASHGVSWEAYVAAATVAMVAGALVAHAWSTSAGSRILGIAASRLGGGESVDRVAVRLRRTGATGVFVSRNLPGMRVYTNIVAGAVGMERGRFALGMVPAVLTWVAAFGLMGALVGERMVRGLARAEVVTGEAILLLAVAALFALLATVVPASRYCGLSSWREAPRRAAAALALDAGAVAVACLAVRKLMHVLRRSGELGLAVTLGIAAACVVAYLVGGRRRLGGTAGERLLHVTYRAAGLPTRA